MNGQANKKIVVIGAGIAGLCTGVYALKSGFDVEIVEMNHSSGGLATNWKRDGYTFETCLHWLLGSKPGTTFHQLWNEVVDLDQIQFFNSKDYLQLETESGQKLSIPRNLEDLQSELLKVAPEDELAIHRFIQGVRRLQKCELPLSTNGLLSDLMVYFKMIPFLPEIRHWSRLNCRELSEQFQNPLLRRFFFGGLASSRMTAIGLLFVLAWMTQGDGGYAIGGSQTLIQAIERNFKNLGGKITFESKVNQISVSRGRAVGVYLDDGTEIEADWVVSAADGHSTLFEWIPEKCRDPKAEAAYRDLCVYPSYLQVSLGVKRDLEKEPGFFSRVLETPLHVDPGTILDQIDFRIFNFDPTFAPHGKTAVTCFLPTFDFQYWTQLTKEDPEAYQTKKDQIARDVISVLDRRLPGIRQDVEVVDVSTPATVIRYTGNWKGSMEGFMITPGTSFQPLPMSLSTIRNFMMVGQWVAPGGGLPMGLTTARRCLQTICKVERRPFLTQVPGAQPESIFRPQVST